MTLDLEILNSNLENLMFAQTNENGQFQEGLVIKIGDYYYDCSNDLGISEIPIDESLLLNIESVYKFICCSEIFYFKPHSKYSSRLSIYIYECYKGCYNMAIKNYKRECDNKKLTLN